MVLGRYYRARGWCKALHNATVTQPKPPMLKGSLSLPNENWKDTSSSDCEITICKITRCSVSHNVVIHSDITWEVCVYGKQVHPEHCPILNTLPSTVDTTSASRLLDIIDQCTICCGNNDDKFVDMVSGRKGKNIKSFDGSVTTYVDDKTEVLSATVASTFAYFGDPNTRETERFVAIFDKFFDCMNARSLTESFEKRKPDTRPYKSANDPRLEINFTAKECFSTEQSSVTVKSLALIMGANPESFTEKDLKKSLEYLFPIGITDRTARPTPISSPDQRERVVLDSKLRPLDLGFYTGTPSYYQIKYQLYSMLEDFDSDTNSAFNLSLECIEKCALERVIGESITDQMHDDILALLKEISKCGINLANYDFITKFLKKFQKQNLLGHLAHKRQTIPIAYGFRKTASARVEVYPGHGSIVVNSKSLLEYFPQLEDRQQVLYPLNLTECSGMYDVIAQVRGGGSTGQAGAIRQGISKAMSFYSNIPFDVLLKNSLLTRDSRIVERKKAGQKKARKKFAWVKR